MNVLNEIKTLLGMEVKLAQMKLEDGVTVIEAEVFEPEAAVFIVNGEDRIALPVGEYKLEDGNVLKVEVEGVIASIEMPEEEMPEAETEAPEVEVEVEAEAAAPSAKKTIESIVKETFFSEIEALKTENIELKAKLESLSAVEVVTEEVTELAEEPKPISFNPENTNVVEPFRFEKNRQRSTIDSIFEKLNK